MSRFSKLVRLLAVLLAVACYAALGWLCARRLVYPYDLEWMEGGMLCHGLRLLGGQPIYAPPSVDFIPYLYTPLYPALLAWLSRLAPGGISYALGRLVSIASFAGATVIAARFAARASGSRAAAAAALAIPAAAFALTGSWYDLARPDSLWLLLVTAALVLAYRAARGEGGKRRGTWRAHAMAAGAGALLVAAFLTKQTASPFMIAGGMALVLLDWRLAPSYVLALAVLGLPSLWWLNHASDGWFWTYVFKLHQSHEFYARRAFLETPWSIPSPTGHGARIPGLAQILGPALLVVPWALWRRRTPELLFVTWLALVGIVSSCIAFGTQWAFTNAFIPGVFFPALAVAVAAGNLVATRRPGVTPGGPKSFHETSSVTRQREALSFQRGRWWTSPPRLRPAAVFALVIASLALHPYDPRRYIPTAGDRAAGDRLVARLRAADGEVLIPFHPFYAHLAGKRTYLHRMGVLDITAAGLGPPRGLVEATRSHRWKLVVFDNKIDGNWFYWPGMQEAYERKEELREAPRVVSGAETVPRYVLVPRGEAVGRIDGEMR